MSASEDVPDKSGGERAQDRADSIGGKNDAVIGRIVFRAESVATAIAQCINHDPNPTEGGDTLSLEETLPSRANNAIATDASTIINKDSAAALLWPIASESQPNNGLPPLLNRAKNKTKHAVAQASA